MSAKLVPTFADGGCRVVSATNSHCRILGFIIIIIYLNCKWVFSQWQWHYNKTQHAK
jgi:hypothetical protein